MVLSKGAQESVKYWRGTHLVGPKMCWKYWGGTGARCSKYWEGGGTCPCAPLFLRPWFYLKGLLLCAVYFIWSQFKNLPSVWSFQSRNLHFMACLWGIMCATAAGVNIIPFSWESILKNEEFGGVVLVVWAITKISSQNDFEIMLDFKLLLYKQQSNIQNSSKILDSHKIH